MTTSTTPATAPTAQLDAKIELYKTFVDTAERTIERRMRNNQFYFSVVAALFIAYAYLAEGKLKSVAHAFSGTGGAAEPTNAITAAATHMLALWMLPLFLLVVSLSWFMLIRSFRMLSTAKYATINEMEAELPLQPFVRERAHYKAQGRSQAARWELVVPVLCCVAAILGLGVPFL